MGTLLAIVIVVVVINYATKGKVFTIIKELWDKYVK